MEHSEAGVGAGNEGYASLTRKRTMTLLLGQDDDPSGSCEKQKCKVSFQTDARSYQGISFPKPCLQLQILPCVHLHRCCFQSHKKIPSPNAETTMSGQAFNFQRVRRSYWILWYISGPPS